MRIQLSARRCDVPNAVRERTADLVGKLTKYDPRLSSAEVTFEIVKHVYRTEAILSVDHEEPFVASGEGDDFRRAVDQMVDRLARMLRRRRSLVRDHQARKAVLQPGGAG